MKNNLFKKFLCLFLITTFLSNSVIPIFAESKYQVKINNSNNLKITDDGIYI